MSNFLVFKTVQQIIEKIAAGELRDKTAWKDFLKLTSDNYFEIFKGSWISKDMTQFTTIILVLQENEGQFFDHPGSIMYARFFCLY